MGHEGKNGGLEIDCMCALVDAVFDWMDLCILSPIFSAVVFFRPETYE